MTSIRLICQATLSSLCGALIEDMSQLYRHTLKSVIMENVRTVERVRKNLGWKS